VSASYQVRDTILAHDWELSGEILIKRIDIAGSEEVFIALDTVSVIEAMPAPIGAELEPPGVDIIDQAFEDFIAGANPILVFTVVSETGDVDPEPTPGDPMVFTWDACVTVQVVTTIDIENIPDPY